MGDESPSLIFGLWASITDFAADAGVSYGTAKQMARRRSVHVRYWPRLIANGRRRGLDIDEAHLVRLFAERAASAGPTEAAE